LLTSCRPAATGDELKRALLDNTDKYSHLEEKVKDGRVLSVYKAVKNYCQISPDMDMTSANEKTSTQKEVKNTNEPHEDL
jgi:hypothetical protein